MTNRSQRARTRLACDRLHSRARNFSAIGRFSFSSLCWTGTLWVLQCPRSAPGLTSGSDPPEPCAVGVGPMCTLIGVFRMYGAEFQETVSGLDDDAKGAKGQSILNTIEVYFVGSAEAYSRLYLYMCIELCTVQCIHYSYSR